eukprot:scaffold52_cov183-Cylindrotheca_fusiformis.AAC.16
MISFVIEGTKIGVGDACETRELSAPGVPLHRSGKRLPISNSQQPLNVPCPSSGTDVIDKIRMLSAYQPIS